MKLITESDQRDKLESARKLLDEVETYVYGNWESNDNMNNILAIRYVKSTLKRNIESINQLLEDEI